LENFSVLPQQAKIRSYFVVSLGRLSSESFIDFPTVISVLGSNQDFSREYPKMSSIGQKEGWI
jgi:hypothetical protein